MTKAQYLLNGSYGSTKEASWESHIGDCGEEGLVVGVTPAQRVEGGMMFGQIDFTADQAMNPDLGNRPVTSQQLDAARNIGAPQKDHAPTWMRLGIERPADRKRLPWRRVLAAQGATLPMMDDIPTGALLQRLQTGVTPAPPDLALPQAIEVLDQVLKSRFARGCKHRNDAERQAQAADAADGIRPLVRALKARVVVELRVSGQPALAPALEQVRHDRGGGDGGLRPDTDAATMQRSAGEDGNRGAMRKVEFLDKVEGIELGVAGGDLRKVPAPWRRRMALPPATIQGAVATEHAIDGSPRRTGLHPTGPRLPNGLSAVFAQHAVIAQGPPQLQDRMFNRRCQPPRGMLWPRRTIGKIDPIQAPTGSPRTPKRDLARGNSEVPCYRAHAFSAPNRTDHRSPTRFNRSFLTIENPFGKTWQHNQLFNRS